MTLPGARLGFEKICISLSRKKSLQPIFPKKKINSNCPSSNLTSKAAYFHYRVKIKYEKQRKRKLIFDA